MTSVAATPNIVANPRLVTDQAPLRAVYARRVVLSDLVAVCVAQLVALTVRFGGTPPRVHGMPYPLLAAALVPVWLGVVAASRGYEPRSVEVARNGAAYTAG